MKRRIIVLLLILLPLYACAEDAAESSLPGQLRESSSEEQAESFVVYPPKEDVAGVQRGLIRYISQDRASDPAFRDAYWLGGEPGSALDLTQKEGRFGRKYAFHVGNMCTRASYSMALSYLGVDVTPGAMSAMTGQRDLDPPYDEISAMAGVERVSYASHVFNTMMENYLADPDYSPVYLYLRKPTGQEHALLVIAALPQTSRFVVLDPSPIWMHGKPYHLYMIALNKTRYEVVNSTFRQELVGSTVLQLYQWRLPAEETAE